MQPVPDTNHIQQFLDFLYEGLEGYIYLGAKDPADPTDWKQEFFAYPSDVGKVEATIRNVSKTHEIYIGPVLYKEPKNAQRENIRVTNVLWTEYDGNAPDFSNFDNPPSLIVQSSDPSHVHVYWRLQEPLYDIDVLDDLNKRISFNTSADMSAWDATQVLRPPDTVNHKRQKTTVLRDINQVSYDKDVFGSLPPAPTSISTDGWTLGSLPNVQDVILKYAFPIDVQKLLIAEPHEVKDRSASLMNAAYSLCQMQLSDIEVFVVLKLLDDRWGKFKERRDRDKRLAQIVTIARNKYPLGGVETDEEQFTYVFGFESLLNTDIEINWVLEPMLMEQGSMLMTGPSGVGKTQFTAQAIIHLALGKNFLHYKVREPKKILFLSLEMGHAELKLILELMAKALTPEEIALLETNLIIVPHGEPWALNKPEGQEYLLGLIEDYEPDGVVVDSIGSAIEGNISSDEMVQPYTKFVDKIRKKYRLFFWAIHHLRKSKDGQGYSQDDVYGNQYILNRATSTYILVKAKNKSLRLRNVKQRLAPEEQDHFLMRDDNLNFHSKVEDVDKNIETNLGQTEPPVGPTTKGGIEL